MDEIVCANTAFRYWRCPPQVHDLYPRLPSSDDGWRTLSQAPFVTDVLKTPIIAVASPVVVITTRDCAPLFAGKGLRIPAQQPTLI